MLNLDRIAGWFDERVPGHALPRALYNSPEVFLFDRDAIFAGNWMLAGFSCELPEPRSTLAVTVGGSPVVITRDREGVVRAFHNSCRHRGAKVCAEGRGRRTRLTCPYHQWVYDLDGRLINAKRMGEGFDRSTHGLKPVHVREVAGALFVCLAETPPEFETFASHLAPLLAPHRLGDAKVAHRSTLVEQGNWKLVMENARECYHCAVGHPELGLTFPVHTAGAHFEQSGDARHDAFGARMAARGLLKGPHSGPWWEIERFPLNDGQLSLTMDGKPAVAKLMVEGDPDIGSLRWAIEPNMFCHSTADTTVVFVAEPTAPDETVVTCTWLVHKDAVEGVDYEVDHLTKLWTVTNLQDRALVENNQLGVNSVGYTPGPYCEAQETYLVRFVEWYCATARAYLARAGIEAMMADLPGGMAAVHPAFLGHFDEMRTKSETDLL